MPTNITSSVSIERYEHAQNLFVSELVKQVLTATKQKFQTLVPFPKIGSAVPTQRALVSVFYKTSPVRSSADCFRAKPIR